MLKDLSLEESMMMSFEGETAKVDDLRSWIFSGINILTSRPIYSMVIWNADKLSLDCQAILLKPMEELGEKMNLLLTVENENQLLSTILSRGVVEYFNNNQPPTSGYWNEIRKCWSSGPAACIAFIDQLEKEKGVLVMEEIVLKLRDSFTSEINEKRISILNLAITCLSELKQTNVNHKLSMDNFLMSSWRIIKIAG
ncbi:MAG: hypothetical protein UW88_C0001G0076 [Candidatus Collierbacteria bacterium GW2011_GWD2_45_10]|nr:MAG: hypothetical protein UW88_C0001G0076 [Candidatus Collierbacteria bacterium GW2011_GWD2_45_10]